MKNKLVSIIVPIYNEEKYLARCINSLLNQTICDNIEIILVNDGSTDSTKSICELYKINNDNIKVVHKINAGQGKARNTGLDVAQGEWIGFVDADDFVENTMYEDLCNMALVSKADMVSCLMISGSQCYESKIVNYKEYNGRYEIANIAFGMVGMKPNIQEDMIFGMSVCRSIFKLDIIKKNNIKFESERKISSEDLLFNLEYLKHISKMVYLYKRLYHYCYNPFSTTHTFKVDTFERDKVLVGSVREILKDFGAEDEVNLSADRLLITKLRIEILNCTYQIKKISLTKVCKIINGYVNDDDVRKVIKTYPGKLLKGNRKLVFYLVKYRLTLPLVCASYIFGRRYNRIKQD